MRGLKQRTNEADMRYWTFNASTCRFERANTHAALREGDVAVVNGDSDVQIIRDHQQPRRWPNGERLVLAGVEFDREDFE
jgi:hypothetical protein